MNRATLSAAMVAVFLTGFAGGSQAATNPAVSAACKSDALKFCRSVIRNETKRQTCMKEHLSELSKGCLDAIKQSHAEGASGDQAAASGANPSRDGVSFASIAIKLHEQGRGRHAERRRAGSGLTALWLRTSGGPEELDIKSNARASCSAIVCGGFPDHRRRQSGRRRVQAWFRRRSIEPLP
jgi:hypothetical protein